MTKHKQVELWEVSRDNPKDRRIVNEITATSKFQTSCLNRSESDRQHELGIQLKLAYDQMMGWKYAGPRNLTHHYEIMIRHHDGSCQLADLKEMAA